MDEDGTHDALRGWQGLPRRGRGRDSREVALPDEWTGEHGEGTRTTSLEQCRMAGEPAFKRPSRHSVGAARPGAPGR